MLPTALVTLVTFLLEVCSTSPVYNMQPAFITNTVGSTSGRNIRNLPCISRRNSNQSGYCMFAIDCLKANGTHLGTCIDGFYFGSCCHIEPVRDIVDNTIDSDIIPHREPPFRISSTTAKTIVSSTQEPTTLKTSLSSSTTMKHNIGVTSVIGSSIKPIIPSTVGQIGQKGTTTTSTTTAATTTGTSSAPTTVAEKLQTFQIVESNTLETKTTKSPAVSTSTVNARPVTKEPTFILTTTTSAPVLSSKITTTEKPPILSSITTKSSSKPTKISTVATTEKIKTTISARPTNFDSTSKPTKAPPTKTTQKPTKSTRPSVTTKKSQTTTKTPTTKPTKYASSTSRPTKRVATTSEKPTTQKITASTEKQATKPATTTIKQHEGSTVSVPPTSISTPSHIQSTDEKSTTESLAVISGNLATNEINDDQHIIQGSSQATTYKPELITWTISSNINTTTSPTEQNFNVTTEDWVPITTPDGWVLLPNVLSNETNPNDTSLDAASIQNSSESSASTMEPPVSPITLPTPFDKPTESVTGMASSTASPPISDGDEEIVTSNGTMLENSTMSNTFTTESSDKPVNMSDFTDVCGRRMYPEARIVGGEKSSFGRWPWQISLRQWRTSTYLHKCGAALLNENWAITAAHCVDNVAPSDLLLRLGEHDLSTESEPYLHQERRVQIVASHPQFDPRTFEYDLALLRFYEPVTFQPNILPVCVPQTDESFVGKTAFVTGWGRLYEDGPLPSILQEVSVPVINNTVCESMYRAAGYIELIPHIFICAGWKRGGFDSCEGDSGGPMVIQRKDNRFLLAGVISWGIGCAEPNQPGVYTRISEFRDWINQILQF